MKTMKIYLTMLLVLTCSAMSARTVTRCYDDASKKFCVRVDGKLMTIAEYDNWLYKTHPSEYAADTVLSYWMKRHLGDAPKAHTKNYRKFTFASRTTRWANKQLVAWVVVDDTGHECSHWVFAGSDESNGGYWWLDEPDNNYVHITLILCADTICWTWGRADRNGKMYMWVGDDKYEPWDWSRANE